MRKQSTEQDITSFFSFLDEHINHGFNNTKKEYTLENYNFNDLGKIDLQSVEDGYLLIFPKDYIDENQFAMDEIKGNAFELYLNPRTQQQYKKMIGNDEIERYSLYHDLNSLYHSKRKEFYNNLIKKNAIGFTSNEERETYINDLLKGLEFHKTRANDARFTVKDNEGNDCLPLHIILSELTEKIQNEYLSNRPVDSLKSDTIKKSKNGKRPPSKVIMEVIRLIHQNRSNIYPKATEYADNDEKFEFIANKIEDMFGYRYSGKTLENNEYKAKGYLPLVYAILKDSQHNNEALQYQAKHNK